MTALALDTLRVSRRLRDAGFSEPQADAVTGILNDSRESSVADLTTRSDLRELKAELKADIVDSKSETVVRFAKVEGELLLIKWMLGAVFAGVASLIAKTFFG